MYRILNTVWLTSIAVIASLFFRRSNLGMLKVSRLLRLKNRLAMTTLAKYLTILLFPIPVFALPSDNHEPIQISAASSQFNYKSGVNIYEGNVKFDQGTSHVIADRAVTQNNTAHRIEQALAYGIKHPAVYSTIPKKGDPIFEAKSDVIKFYPMKSLIVFEGNAVAKQGENSFHGPIIIYNIKEQIVTAPRLQHGRATISIKPIEVAKK